MNLVLSRTRALLVGIVLIVVTNAVVLGGVAYNRSGAPDSTLQLTERELRIRTWSWPENENSSIDLNLWWRVPGLERDGYGYSSMYGALPWVKSEQLRQLGFDVSGDLGSDADRERLQRQPSRRAWFVLEQDGPAYQKELERATRRVQRAEALAAANAGDEEFQFRLKQVRDDWKSEQHYVSRLFVVDSAREEQTLRARYPDRRKYAIVPGSLDISIDGEPGRWRLVGHVHKIDVDAIRVPHSFRQLVEPFAAPRRGHEPRDPRFEATVNFGQRFEPWIAELALFSSDDRASISR